MSPDVNPEGRSKPTLPKYLQPTLRPSPYRTTSQVSSISVGASLPEQESSSSSSRALLSSDPKYHRRRPHSQSHVHTQVGTRAIADSSSTAGQETVIPKIQRTLSAPGTPGRATPTSAHQPSTASTRSPSTYSLSLQALTGTSGSGSGTSTPSRKGKEKAVEDVEVDDVEAEGEMVIHDGDATKGLRELVRRTTIGEGTVPRIGDAKGMEGVTGGMSLPSQEVVSPESKADRNAGKDEFHTIHPPTSMYPQTPSCRLGADQTQIESIPQDDIASLQTPVNPSFQPRTIRPKIQSQTSWVSPKPSFRSLQRTKIS